MYWPNECRNSSFRSVDFLTLNGMSSHYVIGIDIGTGSTKAVALNTAGEVTATAQAYYQTLQPAPGHSEQQPEEIWQAFVKVIDTIQSSMQASPACICLSSCMHSLLLLDEANQPLTNLITWADNRAAAVAERLRCSTDAEHMYTVTGTPIHSMSPLCKLIWFKENDAAAFSKVGKAISIKEYIWFRLFGVFEADHSIASATGLFDNKNFCWSKDALQLAGITQQQLSQLVATNFTRSGLQPSAAEELKLPVATSFCTGASDGCLANVGSDALAEGVAAITIGTSAAVRIASKKPLPHFATMLFSYVLNDETFICGAPTNNGGNVLQWLQQNFLADETLTYDAILKKIATVRAGCDGLIFLPHLHGERGPLWDEKAAGGFMGIHAHHLQAHFIRAALEGVCFSLKSILEIIEEQTVPVQRLHLSGGFVHSHIWMQLLADVTGKTVCVVSKGDASASGAAFWGLKAMGLIEKISLPEQTVEQTIEPNFSHTALYNQQHQIYKTLYGSIKDAVHQLYNLNH